MHDGGRRGYTEGVCGEYARTRDWPAPRAACLHSSARTVARWQRRVTTSAASCGPCSTSRTQRDIPCLPVRRGGGAGGATSWPALKWLACLDGARPRRHFGEQTWTSIDMRMFDAPPPRPARLPASPPGRPDGATVEVAFAPRRRRRTRGQACKYTPYADRVRQGRTRVRRMPGTAHGLTRTRSGCRDGGMAGWPRRANP